MTDRLSGLLPFLLSLLVFGCSAELIERGMGARSARIEFGAEIHLGDGTRNPSTPFLRYRADGRLFAIWTEDNAGMSATTKPTQAHEHVAGKMAPSPLRVALLAASAQVNSDSEEIQGEENGPKVAFGADNRAYVAWSIPSAIGDKTRANIRFAMDDGKGGFTSARTLNEVKDAARFPIIELAPDGNFLIAWIDRRVDGPQLRQLYLMRMNSNGQAATKNYQVGQGLCECCKLGIAFADGGKTIYMVDREVNDKQIRNHVLRKSSNGGATFAAPVQISDDGWQVPSCPHSGPSIGRDSRGRLHVSWFTLGRTEQEAGIYYSKSKDSGKSFALRQLVQANSAPEILYNNLVVGDDDTVYSAWSNLDSNNRAQIYLRLLNADEQSWSPIQQVSNAKGNASRPSLALRHNQLHIA
ncbi:MAG: exo-alpha-sialidase [Deltaproteobacteria bacterium]|nr:exo-alpha-sialidase [Deltaproteobacteria bacterium]